MSDADKNWRQGNTIGSRLELSAEEIDLFFRNNRMGLIHLTVREDRTFVK